MKKEQRTKMRGCVCTQTTTGVNGRAQLTMEAFRRDCFLPSPELFLLLVIMYNRYVIKELKRVEQMENNYALYIGVWVETKGFCALEQVPNL